MKKATKFFALIFAICILLACTFLYACGEEDNKHINVWEDGDNTTTDGGNANGGDGTANPDVVEIVSFEGATIGLTSINLKVNATSLNLSEIVKITEGANWSLYTDENLQDRVSDLSNIALQEGNNVFYLHLVSASGKTKLTYKVIVTTGFITDVQVKIFDEVVHTFEDVESDTFVNYVGPDWYGNYKLTWPSNNGVYLVEEPNQVIEPIVMENVDYTIRLDTFDSLAGATAVVKGYESNSSNTAVVEYRHALTGEYDDTYTFFNSTNVISVKNGLYYTVEFENVASALGLNETYSFENGYLYFLIEEPEIDLKPMFDALIGSLDNTIKVVNDIDDEASISFDLFFEEKYGYSTNVHVAASIDENSNTRNWIYIQLDCLGVELGFIVEMTSDGKEYVYIGQNVLDEGVVWSKLSQIENAAIFGDRIIPTLFDAINSLEDAYFDEDELYTDLNNNRRWDEGEPFEDINGNGICDENTVFDGAKVSEIIDSGLLANVPLVQTIEPAVNLIGGLLFMPVKGVNDYQGDLSCEGGYAASLNIQALRDVFSSLGPILSGLDVDFEQYQAFADMLTPFILGGTLDLTNFTFTPQGEIPVIDFFLEINDDNTFGGFTLCHAYEEFGSKVELGIKNVSFKPISVAKPKVVNDAVEDAEEFAINTQIYVSLAGVGEPVIFNVNIYPDIEVSFDEDGYVDLRFDEAYAFITFETENSLSVIAEYNAIGDGKLYIDLTAINDYLDAGLAYDELQYVVDVNLQELWDEHLENQKIQHDVVANAGAGNVTDSYFAFLNGEGYDIIELVGNLGDFIQQIEEISKYVEIEIAENDTIFTIDLANVMEVLLDWDGLIGGSDSLDHMEVGPRGESIVEVLQPDEFLYFIADIFYGVDDNAFDVDDLQSVIYDLTGIIVNLDNAYENVTFIDTLTLQNGIGISLGWYVDGEEGFTIGVLTNLIEHVEVTEYESQVLWNGDVSGYYFEDGNSVPLSCSNNVIEDKARLFTIALTKIYNAMCPSYPLDVIVWERGEVLGTLENPMSYYAGQEIYIPGYRENGESGCIYYTIEVEEGQTLTAVLNGLGAIEVVKLQDQVMEYGITIASTDGTGGPYTVPSGVTELTFACYYEYDYLLAYVTIE